MSVEFPPEVKFELLTNMILVVLTFDELRGSINVDSKYLLTNSSMGIRVMTEA
jgi:hypothetical protein